MTLKEGSLYHCETTGTVVIVVKVGTGATSLSTEHGEMKLQTAGLSDADLASAAAGVRVKPGVIIRQEVRLAHELADHTHPVTGVTGRFVWDKDEPGETDKKP